jgi:urea transport system ATP-binding protein
VTVGAEPGLRQQPSRRENAEQPLLVVDGVRVNYGESLVLDDISLSAYPGEVVCVMGRNGSGKTTLLKAIMGLLPLRRGRIDLAGEDISRLAPYERARRGIGFAPQGRGVFPSFSVLENLLIGLEPLGGKDSGQIEAIYGLFPVLKQMSRRTAGVLSGGQQQQLAIARALLSNPRLLILDEPTEGIQPSIVEEIERVLLSLRGEVTILLVEQFLDFALSVAGHCYVMEHGAVVLEGTPTDLDAHLVREYVAL